VNLLHSKLSLLRIELANLTWCTPATAMDHLQSKSPPKKQKKE
jgi:hypothetical protein